MHAKQLLRSSLQLVFYTNLRLGLSFLLINPKLTNCTTIPNLAPSPLLRLRPASTSVLAPGRGYPIVPSAMKLAVLALVFAAAAASASPPMEDVILDKNSLADFPKANVHFDSLPPVSFDDYVNIFNDSPNNDFQLPRDSSSGPGLGFPFGDTTGAGSSGAPAPAPANGEIAGRAPAGAIGPPPSETPAAKPPSGSGGESPPAPGAGGDVSDLVPAYGAYGPDQAAQAPGPDVEDEFHVGGASAGVVSAGAVVAALLGGAVAIVCLGHA